MTDYDRKFVCHECVGESYFKNEIQTKGSLRKCEYCRTSNNSFSLNIIAERIHTAIQGHFCFVPEESWGRSGEDVNSIIQQISGVTELIAEDIQECLSDYYGGEYYEENQYGKEALYKVKPPETYDLIESWYLFCEDIKYKARFFSQSAEKLLNELFGNLDSFRTDGGKSVVCTAGPGNEITDIYRARVSQSNVTLLSILKDPIKELGAPPPKIAKNGRMNATGISVFYGATDDETCIAEVRPPVGCHVVVGRFEFTRELRLLNLNLLTQLYVTGSYFDAEYGKHKARVAFLRDLVGELSKPVMPDDETFDYLPTQVVAEYLAESITPYLDGLIYNSSQGNADGKNIILFWRSCRVEPSKVPSIKKITLVYGASEEECDGTIKTFEEIEKDARTNAAQIDSFPKDDGNTNDHRKASLRLDVIKDMDIRKVRGATYATSKQRLERNQVKGTVEIESSQIARDENPFVKGSIYSLDPE